MRRQWQNRRLAPARKPEIPASAPPSRPLLTRMTSRDEDRTKVTMYMCAIAWEYEIGNAPRGTKLYPSLAALKDAHPMWEECGIVEVEVSILGTVATPQY
jgi:hypothetical protein